MAFSPDLPRRHDSDEEAIVEEQPRRGVSFASTVPTRESVREVPLEDSPTREEATEMTTIAAKEAAQQRLGAGEGG